MTDNIIKRHLEILRGMDGHTVEAGWFESARYQAGKDVPEKQVGMSVAKVAQINEFGATIKKGGKVIVIPARPFMRAASKDFETKHVPIVKSLSKKIFDGKLKPPQALAQLGMFMEGVIVESIKKGDWVKNAPATEKAKGFNKPLIHTGQMWQSVTSKVVKSK
jgi:hypothetical protein